MLTLEQVSVAGKRVLLREDLNVPLTVDGRVAHDARLLAALPTIQQLLEKKAAVLLLAHLGRPEEGKFSEADSLKPVAARLSELLGRPVRLIQNWLENHPQVAPGEVVLLENVRFLEGENRNSPGLAKQIAALCDVFVMDAFAVAHRSQASTVGVAEYAPIACAGPLLLQEVAALDKALAAPEHPVVAIVGGSKVSTKFGLLKALLQKVDVLIVGGGIANTFLKAKGLEIGSSLYEVSFVKEAESLLETAETLQKYLLVPEDVAVATELNEHAVRKTCDLKDIQANEKILDIGPKTAKKIASVLKEAKTILWNGPVGVFEHAAFQQGTNEVAQAVADSAAFSIAGGGDTLAAIDNAGVAAQISYISTAGGAFLEYVEYHHLPGIDVLINRAEGSLPSNAMINLIKTQES
jgi:phosphoglycerate kinase